jgi:hydrogenase maturation protein HypF
MKAKEILETFQPTNDPARLRLRVKGRVQGVGFRPNVYRLAVRAGTGGWVRNTRLGVVIEVEGTAAALREFLRGLAEDLPALARIDDVEAVEMPAAGERSFRILESEGRGAPETLFPIDTATCADCLAEMRDSSNRRYRYPFINCTSCGPRFTIIEGLPYDRPLTTMHEFEMDDFCRTQYTNPLDRRFHAEPISCPGCGPSLILFDDMFTEIPGDPVAGAVSLIEKGAIIAIKGLGGYHLASLATDEGVVRRLRQRKRRPAKPFACMFRDLETLRRYCVTDAVEEKLLSSPEAPIVLLRRGGERLPEAVAPRNAYIGAFLPYTPIHHLIMERFEVLIMTSGNFTDEPLISTEEELAGILGPIADAALVHNRRIAHRCDDSIVFAPGGLVVPIRRARGFVPEPIVIGEGVPVPMAALGAQEKSTFALAKDASVIVSPHLGDLGDLRSENNYRLELAGLARLLQIAPEAVVHDLHPDYFTTRLAAGLGVKRRIGVQHHHAHAASVMAEHGLAGPVIAVAFDGTGYGTDGKLWGGEFLLARYEGFERLAALAYVPLPGGEAAIREPWRMALVHLWRMLGERALAGPPTPVCSFAGLPAREILAIVSRGINSPLTSSMGRLFDAVACLLGCGPRVSYEAEAAVALEALAREAKDRDRAYSFAWGEGPLAEIDPAPVLGAVLEDLAKGRSIPDVAAAFHRGVAGLVVDLSSDLARRHGCADVVVSGGVFQNRLLCECVMERARGAAIRIHQHALVPPNDGGVSLGQIAVGAALIRNELARKGSERANG